MALWSLSSKIPAVTNDFIDSHRLQQTENQLYDGTKDLLQLKFDSRAQEKSWMAEKDQLLRKLDSCHNSMRKSGPADAEPRSRAAHPLSQSQQAPKEGSKVFCCIYCLKNMKFQVGFLLHF